MTEALEEPLLAAEEIAGGGRVKEASKDAAEVSSLPLMSVDEAGVGGRPGRGMAVADEVSDRVLPECNDGGRMFKAVTRLDSK